MAIVDTYPINYPHQNYNVQYQKIAMISLSTKQVIVRIVSIIALVQLLIMLLFVLIPCELNLYSEAVLDFAFLTLLSTPLIYFWVINPFVTTRDEALYELNNLAHSDPLTHLPNRRLFTIHLEKYLAGINRHNVHGALLLIDLDGFKFVNDIHGHNAGDKVLVEIAKRLQTNIRSEDIAGRWGGDEFFILIQHLDADERIVRETALWVAEKLINIVKKPIDFNATTLNVNSSIGIRLLGFEELSMKQIIQEADIAMYQAKKAGGGFSVFFEKEME